MNTLAPETGRALLHWLVDRLTSLVRGTEAFGYKIRPAKGDK